MLNKLLEFDLKKSSTENNKAKLQEVNMKDIAVIGMAGKFSKAENIDEFWANIEKGVNCFRDIPEARKENVRRLAAYRGLNQEEFEWMPYLEEIDKFDYKFFGVSPNEAKLIDPNQRLFLETVYNAVEDAGYSAKRLKGSKTGVYAGLSAESVYKQMLNEFVPESVSIYYPLNLLSYVPGRVAHFFDLNGPCVITNTACSSSLVAVHTACQAIRSGECDLAIVGSVSINFFPMAGEFKLSIVAPDNVVRAFDAEANGTAFGEGVAALVLKPLHKALEDKDSIYSVIKGSAVNHDGKSIGLTAPNPEGQEIVITRAWRDAGINPETVEYIESHGTGTQLGDPIEIEGIQKAFRKYTDKKGFCAISSHKTNMGHLDCASGIAGLVKAVMAVKNRKIPPTINFSNPSPKINFVDSPVYVNTRAEEWKSEGQPRRCGVSNFGMSGTNCHVVIEEAPENPALQKDKGPYILTVSSKDKGALKELIKRYRDFVKNKAGVSLGDICYTLNTGREHYNYRLSFPVYDLEGLKNKLETLLKTDFIDSTENEGVYYREHKVVHNKKGAMTGCEISEKEISEISLQANAAISAFIEGNKQDKGLIEFICGLYSKGADINWDLFYSGDARRRLNLPGYPFERTPCWVEIPVPPANQQPINRNVVRNESDAVTEGNAGLYSEIQWKKQPLGDLAETKQRAGILIFKDNTGAADAIVKSLRNSGEEVIEVIFGNEFSVNIDSEVSIRGDLEDYNKIAAIIEEKCVTKILHFSSVSDNKELDDIKDLKEKQKKGFYSLLYLSKAILAATDKKDLEIVIVSDHVNEISGREAIIKPENAVLTGLGKVLGSEGNNISCRAIDIDSSISPETLLKEIKAEHNSYLVAYREGERYIEVLSNIEIKENGSKRITIKDEGVYIVTGGLGGLGLEICKYLARTRGVKLALINRSAIPERSLWKDILDKDGNSKIGQKLNEIIEMENCGAVIECYSADVSDMEEMEAVISRLKNKYGKINGIIHSAGVAGGGLIVNRTEKQISDVISPKIYGAWVLDKLTERDELDFFVVFSSITSIFGGAGQGDYTAANSYLDSFTAFRTRKGRKTLTINWSGWKETGMAFENGIKFDSVFRMISTEKAVQAFDAALNSEYKRVIIGEINYDNNELQEIDSLPLELSEGIKALIKGKDNGKPEIERDLPQVNLLGRDREEDYTATERIIARVWGALLGVKEINIFENFYEMGGNSLLSVKMELEMEKQAIKMKFSDVDEYSTVADLAAFVVGASGKEQISAVEVQEDAEIKEIKVDTQESITENNSVRKVISNMEPFGEIFYQNCFFNSLFPVLKHFGRTNMPILINDIGVYTIKDGKYISQEYVPSEPYEEALKHSGLGVFEKAENEDIIKDIINSISDERPVIVWIDCFDLPLREDTYQKEHLAHTLLIYGYDLEQRKFEIIEHKNRYSLAFKKFTISFEDLENAYKGYLKNLKKDDGRPVYYEFYPEGDEENFRLTGCEEEFKRNYASIMQEKYDVLHEGLEILKKYAETYKMLILDENALKEGIDGLLAGTNDIINARKVEKYKLGHMKLEQSGAAEANETVLKAWTNIRAELGKYFYSRIYRQKPLENTLDLLQTICEHEVKYINEISMKNEKYEGRI